MLSEQPDPAIFQQVLDVGCGTGSWLIEVARTSPGASFLVGVDISSKMIEYARKQVEAQQVSERVEFHVMDALRGLEFPADYFDLVNQRAGTSWLRTWDWSELLQKYREVARPGGVIRITEADWTFPSNSQALTRLSELMVQAFYRAGHLFTPESDSVIRELARLLSRHGFQQVQTCAYPLEYQAGTPDGQLFAEDVKHLFRTIEPFLRKWARVPDDYDELYQQMLRETQQPGFVGNLTLLTAWAVNPPKTESTWPMQS